MASYKTLCIFSDGALAQKQLNEISHHGLRSGYGYILCSWAVASYFSDTYICSSLVHVDASGDDHLHHASLALLTSEVHEGRSVGPGRDKDLRDLDVSVLRSDAQGRPTVLVSGQSMVVRMAKSRPIPILRKVMKSKTEYWQSWFPCHDPASQSPGRMESNLNLIQR